MKKLGSEKRQQDCLIETNLYYNRTLPVKTSSKILDGLRAPVTPDQSASRIRLFDKH